MWSWGQAQGWGRVVGGPNMNFTFLVLRAAPDGRAGHVDVDDIEKKRLLCNQCRLLLLPWAQFLHGRWAELRWRVGWMLLEYYLIVHTAPSAPNR